jgi:multimeric flavodoxin WrbA
MRTRTLLGLSAGNRGGSAEILLKEALRAAEEAGATVELVRVDDLRLTVGPDVDGHSAGADDGPWFWDRLMESEGLIVSTPIYTRTIPGKLRLLGDKISGPQADAAFTAELLRMRAAGEPIAVQFPIDERVLRPRVGGFIAVGGSLPSFWKTLALPLMHTLSASMQLAIVDQVQFAGAGSPASIVLDDDALERARQLGRNVAGQLGRTYDEAEYRGAEGLCPECHLDVIVVTPDGIECATCGARGEFTETDGRVGVAFTPEGQAQSVLTMTEKLAHFREVQETAAAHAALRAEIDAKARAYDAWDRTVAPQR